MSEFDDKLNSILSNPDAMSQIMQLAQSISGEPEPPRQPKPQAAPDLSSLLSGGIDTKLLTKLLPLVQELGSTESSNAHALLYALRPYLKRERQDKIERALQLARLFRLGKAFLAQWEG